MTALTPWQQPVWDSALAALAEKRLGHALLLVGPERMGKAALARQLAQRLLCGSPGADGLACGRCRGCQLFVAGSHPDFRFESREVNEKTGKLRSEIVIEQIRSLGAWFALTPQFGGAQVALITPADAMNTATSNALLKTLEEPAPNRFLLLVSDRPGRLPATIRSRCQRLLFRPPSREVAVDWLHAQGHSTVRAAQALDAARGHPGQAHHWLTEGGLELRERVAADLTALAKGRQAPVELAQAWLADEHAALRLRFAADLAQDCAARGLSAPAAGSLEASGLALTAEFSRLSSWYDNLNRVRAQLDAPLRHDLLLAGQLLEWRNLFSDTRHGARR